MRSRVALLAFVLIPALFAGCADGDGTDADASVDATLVSFEADWQCERERHAFDDLADLDARFEANRAAAGISAEAYAVFQDVLAGDRELREDVLAAYRVVCS